jgi:cofilin
MASSHTNLQSLVNAKAALDLGLLDEADYVRVKESFLKAQQLRAAIDAGLIEDGEQVEQARGGFLSMVLGAEGREGAATATRAGQARAKPAPPPKAPAPPAPMPAPPRMPPAPPLQQKTATPPAPPAPPAIVPKNIPKTSNGAKAATGGKSMSGISLSEDAINVFYLIRSKSKYRWVIWKINDDSTDVIIEQVGDPASCYQDFLEALPEDDCRYAVFDYEFVGGDGQSHSKIVFINWAPDVARVKSKMMYASTKDFFKSKLDGLSIEMQGSDRDEVEEATVGEAVRSLKKNY